MAIVNHQISIIKLVQEMQTQVLEYHTRWRTGDLTVLVCVLINYSNFWEKGCISVNAALAENGTKKF